VQRQQTQERRGHTRAKHPTQGRWRGASGNASCRIGDISLGGCFIFSQAMPVPGESTTVTIELNGVEPLAVSGHVVYVELGMGFSVRFHDIPADDARSLTAIVEMLSRERASA